MPQQQRNTGKFENTTSPCHQDEHYAILKNTNTAICGTNETSICTCNVRKPRDGGAIPAEETNAAAVAATCTCRIKIQFYSSLFIINNTAFSLCRHTKSSTIGTDRNTACVATGLWLSTSMLKQRTANVVNECATEVGKRRARKPC